MPARHDRFQTPSRTPLGRFVVLVTWLLAHGLLVGSSSQLRAADRPNVLFILSDDLNNRLGCYGDPQVRSPHLDRLAARGVRFERAYCAFPLCGPSRNSMLTGLYPNSTGIFENGQVFRQTIPSHRSLPHAFRDAGYYVVRIGKLYHYNVPRSVGTNGHDDPGSWEMEINPAGVDRLVELPQVETVPIGQGGGSLAWFASPHGDRQHTDGMMADDASWVLERCAARRDRPFFLALGFFRPHMPYLAPKDPYFDWYPAAEMPVVQGVEEDQRDLPEPAIAQYRHADLQLSEEQRRRARQAYYASISFMDAQVGRVLDTLDRLGLAENTIIVFTSDHGYHLGEHGQWHKMSLFEESARVPLLVVAPGQGVKGAVAASPVSQVDLFPTLAELCGVAAPANLQGQSLKPMLVDPQWTGRGWAVTQVSRKLPSEAKDAPPQRYFGYSLRTPRWRYTEWDEGRRGRELYDHESDPRELTNVAEQPAHTATLAILAAQLRDAVKASYPPSGAAPELKPGTWAPNLTDP